MRQLSRCIVLVCAAGGPSSAQTFTSLASLNGANGSSPLWVALVEATDGNFYGTSELGGAYSGGGTILKMTPAGVLTALYSFNFAVGGEPSGGLIQGTNGNLYGTTSVGGTGGKGTILKSPSMAR